MRFFSTAISSHAEVKLLQYYIVNSANKNLAIIVSSALKMKFCIKDLFSKSD